MSFTLAARFGLLPELAHVWLSDELDPRRQAEYTARFGLPTRDEETVPWRFRGVEHAAEILAWALIDEPIELVRIDHPTCEAAASGFELLTGVVVGDRCEP